VAVRLNQRQNKRPKRGCHCESTTLYHAKFMYQAGVYASSRQRVARTSVHTACMRHSLQEPSVLGDQLARALGQNV